MSRGLQLVKTDNQTKIMSSHKNVNCPGRENNVITWAGVKADPKLKQHFMSWVCFTGSNSDWLGFCNYYELYDYICCCSLTQLQKCSLKFWNIQMSTGLSYMSQSSDLKVYICSLLIHFEHLPSSHISWPCSWQESSCRCPARTTFFGIFWEDWLRWSQQWKMSMNSIRSHWKVCYKHVCLK